MIKVNVIIPKEIFDVPKVRREIEHTLNAKSGPEVRKMFERTIRTWSKQPVFKQQSFSGTRVMWVKVLTYSVVYRLVNAGARPHIIRPRRAKMLRFQKNFRAKSRPRLIGAFAGGKSGNYISARVVNHPGHEAREFDQEIAEQYIETFRKDIRDAVMTGIVHK